MINLDERLDEAYRNTVYSGDFAPPGLVFGINLNNDTVYQSLKVEIKHLFADYIESIELPEKVTNKVRQTGTKSLTSIGYNLALKDCQAKLDKAIKL